MLHSWIMRLELGVLGVLLASVPALGASREIDLVAWRGVSCAASEGTVAFISGREGYGDYKVFVRSLERGEDRVVWAKGATQRNVLRGLSFCPDGQILGFVERVIVPPSQRFYVRLLSSDAKQLVSIPDGCYFDWSPDGRHLAYVAGNATEWGDYGFRPTGVWVYNLAEGTSVQVSGPAYRLSWAAFDESLYVELEKRVWRYDLQNKTFKETAHRGFNFSPDGMYYIAGGVGADDNLRVFETGSETELTGTEDCLITAPMQRALGYCTWLDRSRFRCRLRGGKPGRMLWDYIIDLRKGEIRGTTDRVVCFCKQSEEVLLLKDGLLFQWTKVDDLPGVSTDMVETEASAIFPPAQ